MKTLWGFFLISEKLHIQDLPYPHLCEKAIHVDITVSTDTEQIRMRLKSSKLYLSIFINNFIFPTKILISVSKHLSSLQTSAITSAGCTVCCIKA